MKQKLLLFFVLFSFIMFYGQTTRYIYETSVNPDSINLVTMKTERTFLDIKASRSLFISENKLIRDSLFANFKPEEKENRKKEDKNFSKSGKIKRPEGTFFEYFISKNIPEQKVYYYDRVGAKQIYYQEDRPIKWEITNDVQKQNGYQSQKATANFGGRIWTAWFTKDINISDGPYKFSGLPGLIVKLEDDKGDYKFDLVKKIIVQNAFEEPLSSDAKQSTRINFNGDKAALELEFVKNRKSMAGSGAGMQNFGGGGRHGGMGGMQSGGHHGGGGGMGRRGEMGGDMQMPSMSTDGGGTSVMNMNTTGQNPIELR
ncbi:GLPGLI family protein [Chryseobacterium sp. MMS23-Vi53]|uniref:GLPGLI family protein n=1 Tax=Chryseobacterium sp. MMS23-Vi53 TaxID=3386644 RepID=UPI0039E9E912